MDPIELLMRNRYTREHLKANKNKVNLEYYRDDINLGDQLSQVICDYMLRQKGLSFDSQSRTGYSHLMAVGSLLGGRGYFDATVWGTGVRSFFEISVIGKARYFQKLDVRAVRGPLTRQILVSCGKYHCPQVYGDPAVLMPLVYSPAASGKSGKTGLVLHYLSGETASVQDGFVKLDIKTKDYRGFIDRLLTCNKVISSSLHGLILAESYGIPAVLLCGEKDDELLKFHDWYLSTGRRVFPIASSIEEAKKLDPPQLPQLDGMRQALMDSFPYDMWI